MANQIKIDIVAETSKLTTGINDANGQIDGMSTKLKGAAAAAGAAASAFVLKAGVTFLKQGIDEAKEAAETMRAATTTFGEGSAALEKITADADAFGKAIAVDNDVIIQLATQLGSRLPADSKILSAELVNLAFDVEAFTGGAIAADAVTGKLAKAFADGQLKATELTKIFPDLEASVYAQAEALSKAGDNQGALNILIEAGQKKYGDAAEKNVTASQKFETALANLKETIGAKLLPTIEKLVGFVTTAIEKFSALPGPVQNVILGLTAIVAIGGPLLGFLASTKIALETLGLTTKLATAAQWLFNAAMSANPIGIVIIAIVAIIAIIVLLVKNWDSVTEAVSKFWEMIKDVVPKAWKKVLELKDKVVGFVGDIIEIYLSIPSKMLGIGKDIVYGIWNGIQSVAGWLKTKVFDFFGNLVPSWAKKVLGIGSPSKVFARYGRFIVEGLAVGIERSADLAKAATEGLGVDTIGAFPTVARPRFQGGTTASPAFNITINAGAGADPYSVGRAVTNAIDKYSRISSLPNQRVTL
jgi:hypothetical protein